MYTENERHLLEAKPGGSAEYEPGFCTWTEQCSECPGQDKTKNNWCQVNKKQCLGCGGGSKQWCPDGLQDYVCNSTNCSSASNFVNEKFPKNDTALSYACLDWSVGSNRMEKAADAYKNRTGDNTQDVIFGVGSYDAGSTNMGKCYEIQWGDGAHSNKTNKKLILQVVNEGGDVHNKSFDVQQVGGGFGICNAVTNETYGGGECKAEKTSDKNLTCAPLNPMFEGSTNADWGMQMGGWRKKAECDNLPDNSATANSKEEKTLKEMCEVRFNLGLTVDKDMHENNVEDLDTNPPVKSRKRIQCPQELYTITGLRRSDEDFADNEEYIESEHPGEESGILTSMFDGCKPSSGWAGNIKDTDDNIVGDPNYPATVGCQRDGFTRNMEIKSV